MVFAIGIMLKPEKSILRIVDLYIDRYQRAIDGGMSVKVRLISTTQVLQQMMAAYGTSRMVALILARRAKLKSK